MGNDMNGNALKFVLLVMASLLFGTAGVIRDTLHDATKEGLNLYEKEKYQEALEAFGQGREVDAENPVLAFDVGNTLLQMGKLDEALQEFQKALRTEDKKLKSRIYYNMGNAGFKKQDFQKSLEYYRSSLLLDPTQKDAKKNLELALKKLQQQKQQKNEQDQDQNQQKDQDQQEKQEGDKNRTDQKDQQTEKNNQNQNNQQDEKDQKEKQGQQGRQDKKNQQDQQDQKNTQQQQEEKQKTQQAKPEDRQQQDGEKKDTQRMSPEQAQRILQALANQEKAQLQKLIKAKAKSKKKGGRDW